MALLNTTQAAAEEEPVNAAKKPIETEPGGELTITAEQVGKEIASQIDPNQQQALKQAVNKGMEMLFSKETHNQIFDSIRPEDQVPIADELGTGATNLMMAMYGHSKGTMPAEIMVLTGAILLAKACEFVNETGMAAVTDADYAEAFELFAVNIQDKLNPNFRKENGLEPAQQAEQPMPQQKSMQQPGGLLNIGGQAA